MSNNLNYLTQNVALNSTFSFDDKSESSKAAHLNRTMNEQSNISLSNQNGIDEEKIQALLKILLKFVQKRIIKKAFYLIDKMYDERIEKASKLIEILKKRHEIKLQKKDTNSYIFTSRIQDQDQKFKNQMNSLNLNQLAERSSENLKIIDRKISQVEEQINVKNLLNPLKNASKFTKIVNPLNNEIEKESKRLQQKNILELKKNMKNSKNLLHLDRFSATLTKKINNLKKVLN